jgi:hypothetical protein
MSKYQYKLKSALENSMRATIADAVMPEGGEFYESKINNQNLVDGLNQILAEIDGELARIKCKAGTGCVYEITPSAYNTLRGEFGLT